jgi:hypothetical protein
MDWNSLVDTIQSRQYDKLKRLPVIQQIYDSRPRSIPSDGLHPNGYPYHVGKRIYNYVLFGSPNKVKYTFPDNVEIVCYVNHPKSRSVPEKFHVNIFLHSDYVPNGYLDDIPPNIELVKYILYHGYKQYSPYHPTIYLYYEYLLNGGDRYFKDFLILVDPWFRNLK